ncbi:cytochrome b/b6 domain-containing protein [Chromohalobacter sp. HP20-39]|uniref:cytochrome b/b6 domain-containing protein n=1 Tax=Chromohalobacter sp. HP20-39 TaxID=3079306 RepID=UPI00294B40E7|nr:cytochrome b/b6 domain-containing protein [Chromohalobacter sp. HP20-39]MDV6318270.1 cytochrome b/b6 domain-containing protein [Chromohalobacter sp. HP20-39]
MPSGIGPVANPNPKPDSSSKPASKPEALESSRLIKRHSLGTRLWHWTNFLCLIVLLMSGLQIFNAHPALYWGEQSGFSDPFIAIHAQAGNGGQQRGVVQIAGYTIDTTGVLGLSDDSGRLRERAFPDWSTLPGSQWLAMGRNWHFLAAWIFAPSVVAYLLYIVVSRRRRGAIFPTRQQLRDIPRTIVDHARFHFHHEADYNGIQKLTYLLVLFVLLPMMILTGLTMSPLINATWPLLTELFGGRQSARTLHFICAFSLVVFFFVHIALVLVSGVFNNLRSMVTGRYRITERPAGPVNQEDPHE